MDVQALHTDDGIVLRVPDTDEPPPAGIAEFDPDELEPLVTAELGGSALFASRFRECAARALLLPRRQPGRRSPLWQQRQRAAQLLAVAARYGTFPIVLETVRECLQDVFDVPALIGLMRDLASRKVRLVEVETPAPSPFGRSLLFRYVGAFMYEGDSPLAERRAQALALDSSLLAELLGQADLRELLDPEVVEQTQNELQRLAPGRACRDLEAVADLLRTIGPLSAAEVAERCAEPGAAPGWLAELAAQRRAIEVRISGEARWAAIEDAGRLRDALGVPLPVGVPAAFTEPVPDPLGDLVARYARCHGPFTTADVARRYGLGQAVVTGALRRLAAQGRVSEGEFRPGGRGAEWCDAEVLRLLRRRCLARLRKEAEPVPPEVAWRVPARLAERRPAGRGRRRAAARPELAGGQAGRGVRRGRAAGRGAGAGLRAGDADPARPGARLPARAAGRADRRRRDRLGGRGRAAGRRRLAGAGARAHRPAAAAPAGGDHHDAAARGGARGPGRRRRAVLPDDRRPGGGAAAGGGAAWLHRHRGGGGDLGPGVGGPAHQRHPGAAAHGPRHRAAGGGRRPAGAPGRPRWASRLGRAGAGRDRTGWAGPMGWAGRAAGWQAGRPGDPGWVPLPGRPGRTGRFGTRRPGSGRMGMASRTGPPTVTGRWSLLPEPDPDPTRRLHALARTLLERHGILTRGAVTAERTAGGFGALYPVLRAMEEAGQCRRGYFVEGLGGAQFALPGAVDRMRAMAADAAAPAPGQPPQFPGSQPGWPGAPGETWHARGEGTTRPGRDRAGGGRPRQPVRRGAALARPAR